MEWHQFWSWFRTSTPTTQKDILDHLQLETFIKNLPSKYQKEVLENAPAMVIRPILHLLKPAAVSAVGYKESQHLEQKIVRILLK